MKVLLRQSRTGLYYVSLREWTADAKSASTFDDVNTAIALSREANLTGVEVVLAYDDPVCDLVLPVQPRY